MQLQRRTLLLAAMGGAFATAARGAERPKVRVGVLRFGTVSWELEVIRRHKLDEAAGISVNPVMYAGNQATQVALQSGDVNITVQDWLWVSRQRHEGADFTFAPFSNAIGDLVAPPNSPVQKVQDLPGHKLGVAGSPIDKSWLILRAYAKRKYGFDPDTTVQKNFGAAPLLAQELSLGRLDAALTFWPYAARAEASGMRRVLAMDDAIAGLGISRDVPVIGYIYSEKWARAEPHGIAGFLSAAAAARKILATSDEEWQKLKPLTRATSEAELILLRDDYRRGIPRQWGEPEIKAAEQLYTVLVETGGTSLVGPAGALAPGTFQRSVPL